MDLALAHAPATYTYTHRYTNRIVQIYRFLSGIMLAIFCTIVCSISKEKIRLKSDETLPF